MNLCEDLSVAGKGFAPVAEDQRGTNSRNGKRVMRTNEKTMSERGLGHDPHHDSVHHHVCGNGA